MKMMLMLCTVALLLGSIQAFTHEDANKYMDVVLNGQFQEEAKYSRLEPYKIDDIKIDFNTSGQNRGSVALTKGRLINLTKVKRGSDCTVPHWQSSNISFTCFLEFDRLEVRYTGSGTYDNTNVTFVPGAIIKGTNLTVQVTANKQEDIPRLKLMFVQRTGEMDFYSEQTADVIDIVRNIFTSAREAIVKYVTVFLHRALNGRFKDALAYSIYKTPFAFPLD